MIYTCETCGARSVDTPDEWHYERLYWWHVPCVTWYGRHVDLPSGGRGLLRESDGQEDRTTKPPMYEIATVTDFLAVPEDRLPDCLEEFAGYLSAARSYASLPGVQAVGPFVWRDDGQPGGQVEFCAADCPRDRWITLLLAGWPRWPGWRRVLSAVWPGGFKVGR
jgi:hypothetical protein